MAGSGRHPDGNTVRGCGERPGRPRDGRPADGTNGDDPGARYPGDDSAPRRSRELSGYGPCQLPRPPGEDRRPYINRRDMDSMAPLGPGPRMGVPMPSLSDRRSLAPGGDSAIGLATAASFSDRVLAVMLLGILALMLSGMFASAFAAPTELVQPQTLIVDGSL